MKQIWYDFEAWVASKLPSWKTKALQLGSLVYAGGVAVQGAWNESGIAQVVESKTLLIVMAVINMLTFWLRGLSTRVEARQAKVDAIGDK